MRKLYHIDEKLIAVSTELHNNTCHEGINSITRAIRRMMTSTRVFNIDRKCTPDHSMQ